MKNKLVTSTLILGLIACEAWSSRERERESSVVRSVPTRTVLGLLDETLEAVSGISQQLTQVSTDLEAKIEGIASGPGESTPAVDIDTTEITSTLGEIKGALTDPEAGLSKRVDDMRIAIDGNGDQQLVSLMKRVSDIETSITTMYAMREVDRILEGVQLPNGEEAIIRRHYLAMIRLNELTDPIKIAQYSSQWRHQHRGHCDATAHTVITETLHGLTQRPNHTVIIWQSWSATGFDLRTKSPTVNRTILEPVFMKR
jgi:hypothetical protein